MSVEARVIARALSEIRAEEEEERLASEAYRFCAQEASKFAEASTIAVAEALEYADKAG
jgi:hypothetical protein